MPVTPESPLAPAPPPTRVVPSGVRWQQLGDQVFRAVCLLMALAVPAVVVLMLALLVRDSLPALRAFGARFLIGTNWDPRAQDFGALPFIYGTLVTSAIAMFFAVPLGVGAAAYLAEIASGPVRRLASFLIELLAAIPSVVFGFWGVFFLVPILQRVYAAAHIPNRSGQGMFTAGLLLAIMIIPYIAAITFDVCRAVPASQRQGALALGATRWQMIWSVVLPYARPGIIGGCFLALGRALGETMAVAMLIGNVPRINASVFALGYSIPSVIANELPTAGQEVYSSALVELGLVLFLVTVVINCLARLLIWRVGRPGGFLGLAPWRVSPGVMPPLDGPGTAHPPFLTEESVKADGPDGRARPLVSSLTHPYARPLNRAMTWVLGGCLVVVLLPLFHILGYVTWAGIGNLSTSFFTNLPIDTPPGLGNALIGSALMVGLATFGAVPVGLLAALYLTEFRTGRFVPIVRFVGELLGGVPSVVIGIFAYALLVVPWGFSAWAGAFALGVMMIPIVMRASEESLRLVPRALRDASYALGASRWQTVARVIVPASLPAIVTGVFLAVARIAGETAPLLFTAYNSNFWPRSAGERTPFLTYYIYFYSLSDDRGEQRLAWAAALVLLAFVMVLNVGIRVLAGRRVIQASRAD